MTAKQRKARHLENEKHWALIEAAPDLLEFAKMVSAGVAEEGSFTVKVGTPADKILQAIIAKAERHT